MRQLRPDATVRNLDVLELTNAAFRGLYGKAYLDLVNKAPHVLGDQLMTVADVVVSKPGGLTTSEVLARGAAMAVVNPIPGQESGNSDFLLENGAAIKINTLATLTHKLGRLLRDPARLAGLKANARLLGRPQAAAEVCRLALRLAGSRDPSR